MILTWMLGDRVGDKEGRRRRGRLLLPHVARHRNGTLLAARVDTADEEISTWLHYDLVTISLSLSLSVCIYIYLCLS